MAGISRRARDRTLRCRIAVLLFICLLFALPASAQFDTGTITGSVTDTSGAAVPRATVVITNSGMGIQTTSYVGQL